MIVDAVAFLCGYFSVDGPMTLPAGWDSVPVLPENETDLKNFYFPEFVDFWGREVSCWQKEVGKDISIVLRDGTGGQFRAGELRLYKMPGGLVLCTAKLVFNRTDIDLVTQSLSCVRNCCYYDRESLAGFLSEVIGPLDEAYRCLTGKVPAEGTGYSCLVENGNKFKIFQIIQSEDCPEDALGRDRFLYAAGTLTPYTPDKPMSTDARYFDRIMEQSRIGVFSSWTALALLDTVTFVSKPLKPFMEKIWQNDYFGMVYLYELYRKCVLYHYNVLFREERRDPAQLQKELDVFGRRYTFAAISYNFLPAEIDRCITAGLDIEKEDVLLNRFLAKEVAAREEESDNRREQFLQFLTLLASCSAVWDIACLVDEMLQYDAIFPSKYFGYRLCTAILFAVIAVVAFLTVRGRRRKAGKR